MTDQDQLDADLTALERAVESKGMSLAGALARAAILGMNYQVAVARESAANAAWGAAEQARFERGES